MSLGINALPKLKAKFSDNLGQNICGVFHVLAQFLCTANEMGLDYYYQTVNVRVASRAAND